MMKSRSPLLCLIAIAAIGSASAASLQGRAHYDVIAVTQAPNLENAYSADYWRKVPELSGGFHFPWRDVQAPQTTFRAVHDAQNLYMVFTAKDPDIVLNPEWVGEKETVSKEDRVEVFFTPSPMDAVSGKNLPYYYGLEIDPKGRTHDYRARYYRHLETDWNLNGLKTTGEVKDGEYIVRIQIPLNALKEINVLKDNGYIATGLFRGEFSHDKSAKNGLDQGWISWVDPQTPKPDFHVDSAFGIMRLLPPPSAPATQP